MSFQPHKFGKYFLTERIANGGMAEILKARSFGEMGFEKSLAIKKILPHLSRNPDFINMLIDEAKINVQLHHMNIVEVYDFGRAGEEYFIAMEFIDGVDLRTIARRLEKMNRRLPVGAAVHVVAEICKGLDYAHRKTDSQGKPLGIVHRDISPPNILISWEGEVKIVDFGIAEAESKISETSVGILKGKLPYMSPEQTYGMDLDPRSDVFSAAVILYELLTCKHLFEREDSSLRTIDKIRNFKPVAPFLPPEIPGEIESILIRALQNKRQDRYPSAAEFLKDLNKFIYTSPKDAEKAELAPLLKQIFQEEISSRKQLQLREEALEKDMKTRRANISDGGQEILVSRTDYQISDSQLNATDPPLQSKHSVHQIFDFQSPPAQVKPNFNFQPSDVYRGGISEMINSTLHRADPVRKLYPIENSLLPQHEGVFDFEDSDGAFTPSDFSDPLRPRPRRLLRRAPKQEILPRLLPERKSHFSRREQFAWAMLIGLVLYLLLPELALLDFSKPLPISNKFHLLVSKISQ